MRELRFHRDVYRGVALDETIKVFSRFGAFVQREEPGHWVVEVSAKTAAREAQLVGEFANYALGLTIKQGGPT